MREEWKLVASASYSLTMIAGFSYMLYDVGGVVPLLAVWAYASVGTAVIYARSQHLDSALSEHDPK